MDVPDTLPAGQYIIYALIDPTDGFVHYVGQTGQPKRRLMAHLRTQHHHRSAKAQWMRLLDQKAEWVRLLDQKGQKPLMQVLERVSGKRMALIKEREWVHHFQEQGMPLLNVISSGTPPLLPGTGCQPLRSSKTADPLESEARRQREERILDTAVSLLLRWGYRKTTLNDVAYKAGVGSVTSSLPWRDKSELFQAAIFHEKRRVNADIAQRIAADPGGECFYNSLAHTILAILSNPLLVAIVRNPSAIFADELELLKPAFLKEFVADFNARFAQLQQAEQIRADLPVPAIIFLIDALKIGIIHMADLLSQEQMPSIEQLTEAISDMIYRWLEPEQLLSSDGVKNARLS